jgi:hypothetical protein
MNCNRPMVRAVILVLLIAAVVLVPGALAQGGYDLSWWTADGGGTQAGGGYSLASTTGQHEALTWSGGGYTLAGGFWAGGPAVGGDNLIFLPLVVRDH